MLKDYKVYLFFVLCRLLALMIFSCLTMQVGVVATPDIHSFDLTERDHFIILGCDGLWGVCVLETFLYQFLQVPGSN